MNLTALIPLLKLLKDAGEKVSPIGPPAPDDVPTDVTMKPVCPPGHYASKDTFGHWSCVPIPKGR